jgi:hypothetical protein
MDAGTGYPIDFGQVPLKLGRQDGIQKFDFVVEGSVGVVLPRTLDSQRHIQHSANVRVLHCDFDFVRVLPQ